MIIACYKQWTVKKDLLQPLEKIPGRSTFRLLSFKISMFFVAYLLEGFREVTENATGWRATVHKNMIHENIVLHLKNEQIVVI